MSQIRAEEGSGWKVASARRRGHPRRGRLLAGVLAGSALAGGSLARADDGEFARLLAGFGPLVTLAGTGLSEDRNDWRPEFEGGPAEDAELSNPHMCMADAAGNYYIADKESHSVLRIDPDGTVHTFAGTHRADATVEEGPATEVPLDSPNGLHVLPDGTVYILDFLNSRVCRVGADGFLTTVFRDPAGFGAGRGLWVNPPGNVIYYCASGSVKRWTPSGGIEVVTDGLVDPGNLTVDPQGLLVVTDRGAHRIYRVAADGGKTVIAGNGATGGGTSGVPATQCALEQVRGVAFLPSGAYFLATMKGGDIWYVDTEGITHLFVAGTGSGNVHAGEGEGVTVPGDKISEPRAVTVAPNGEVIITCNDTGYVRVVRTVPGGPPALHVREDPKGTVRLLWEAAAGRVYEVEGSEDLGGWSLLERVPGAPEGGPAEWIDPRPVAGARFYRLRMP